MYSWPTAARFPSTGHKYERAGQLAPRSSGGDTAARPTAHFPFADEAEGVRLAEIREFQLGSAMAVPSQLGSDGACSRTHRAFCARCARDWSGCLLELPARADQGLYLGCLHRVGQPVAARDPGHHRAELAPRRTADAPGRRSAAGHAPGGFAFARMNWVSTRPPTCWTSSIVTVPVRTPAEAAAGEGPAIRPAPRRWPRHQKRGGRTRTGHGPGHDRRAPDRLPLPGRSPSAAPDTRREPGRALIARFGQRRASGKDPAVSLRFPATAGRCAGPRRG